MISKIFSNLKVLCLNHPFLYKITHKLSIAKGDLCNDASELCMEGFPSSANSYSLNLARLVLSEEKIASHCHAAANMRLALARGIPVIFVSREPLGAISSHIVRHGKDQYNACLTYISLYEYAVKHFDEITVTDFEDATKNPMGFIQLTCETLDLAFSADKYQNADEQVKAHIIEYEEQVLKTEGFHGLLPDPKKESEKQRVKAELDRYPLFQKCRELYDTLQSKLGVSA